MLTGLLVLVLLFSSPNALRGMGRNARLSPQDTTFLYLPAVSYELPDLPLQMYATLGVSNDTPHMAYTWGYLLNTATEPLYDATLRVTVMRIEKNCCGQVIGIYTDTYTLKPVFTSTLPGQLNPFFFTLQSSKVTDYRVESVITHTARIKLPTDSTYVALDASHWMTGTDSFGNSVITGTVRNNTALSVRDVRLLFTDAIYFCGWSEAPLLTTTLKSGESTSYATNYCGIDRPIITVAQGAVLQ